MKTATLKQSVTFKASPNDVYELIMDEKKHAAFTGGPVTMSKKIKGTFRAFDGYAHGYNIELEPGKKIVQAWHFKEDGWPDEHYSVCTFRFETKDNGTRLTFTQTGIPEHKLNDLKKGWKEYYWNPMKSALSG